MHWLIQKPPNLIYVKCWWYQGFTKIFVRIANDTKKANDQMLEIEMTTNERTFKHDLFVIDDLTENILIGMDLLTRLEIDENSRRQLEWTCQEIHS